MTSWLSTASHAALFDELSKIAAAETEKPKHDWKQTAWTIGQGALGAGLGYGAVDLAIAKVPAVRKFLTSSGPNRARAAKVILPIMGGAALMLADRYRKKMDEGMFQREDKK
jgi:hypothetical protein